jgi:hypothetical protein
MKPAAEEIAEAAINKHGIGNMQFKFIALFGAHAEFVQGERRFITRRMIIKVFLMDKRLIQRRSSQEGV